MAVTQTLAKDQGATAAARGGRAPQARLITTVAHWRELAPVWSGLLQATPGATPWQSWCALEPWWRHLAGERQLRVVVVARGGRPCMILPLQLSRISLRGLRLRLLEPIGMPDDINRPSLALGRPDAEALDCALELLWRCRREWDGLRIDEKSVADREVARLQAFAAGRRLRLHLAPLHPCPWLDLRQPWEEYRRSRGSRLGKNLRAARRRLEALGPLRLQQVSAAEDMATALDVLLEVQTRSWKHAAGIGLSQSEGYRRYLREFVLGMAARGAARVLILYCGERPVAATLALTDETTYYSAQIAHDRAYDRMSPGTLLESLEFEALMRDGEFRRYDFLGAALNNKRRWTDHLDMTWRLLLLRRTPAGWAAGGWYFALKPLLRRWRARYGSSVSSSLRQSP
jgi:CelD/BcsL family acetyltransferase involved in cellulose biosynthesis